jgi:hypothetical protein
MISIFEFTKIVGLSKQKYIYIYKFINDGSMIPWSEKIIWNRLYNDVVLYYMSY